jgi:hypothetical protein
VKNKSEKLFELFKTQHFAVQITDVNSNIPLQVSFTGNLQTSQIKSKQNLTADWRKDKR